MRSPADKELATSRPRQRPSRARAFRRNSGEPAPGDGLCRKQRGSFREEPVPDSAGRKVRFLNARAQPKRFQPSHMASQSEAKSMLPPVNRFSTTSVIFTHPPASALTAVYPPPGRRGRCPPRPPQIRTRRFPASGSSRERFVPAGVAVDDPGRWQRMMGEERVEVSPDEQPSSRSTFQPLAPYLHDLVAIFL